VGGICYYSLTIGNGYSKISERLAKWVWGILESHQPSSIPIRSFSFRLCGSEFALEGCFQLLSAVMSCAKRRQL
jgi:hypothetical protein